MRTCEMSIVSPKNNLLNFCEQSSVKSSKQKKSNIMMTGQFEEEKEIETKKKKKTTTRIAEQGDRKMYQIGEHKD